MFRKFSRWFRSKSGQRTLFGALAVLVVVFAVGQLVGWWDIKSLFTTAASPSYSIQRPRMTLCAVYDNDPCNAQESSVFLPNQAICAAWSEANMQSVQLHIYAYDETEQRVLTYTAPISTTASVAKTGLTCRLERIGQLTKPGTYETDFVIANKGIGQPLRWSIAIPKPTPTPPSP